MKLNQIWQSFTEWPWHALGLGFFAGMAWAYFTAFGARWWMPFYERQGLIGGTFAIVAALMAIFYEKRQTDRRRREDLANAFLGLRRHTTSEEFYAALNQLPITFAAFPAVTEAWLHFLRVCQEQDVPSDTKNAALEALLRAVGEAGGAPRQTLSSEVLMNGFGQSSRGSE